MSVTAAVRGVLRRHRIIHCDHMRVWGNGAMAVAPNPDNLTFEAPVEIIHDGISQVGKINIVAEGKTQSIIKVLGD